MNRYFENVNTHFKNKWYKMGCSNIVGTDAFYSRQNDKEIKRLSDYFVKLIKNHKNISDEEIIKDEMYHMMRRFMIDTLGLSEKSCEELFDEKYYNCSKEFVDRAMVFQADMEFKDVFQALRNVWVMNSMQIYLGADVELTDSIYAYSMLYPLTDNFLDNPDISDQSKKEFNKRFRIKIESGNGRGETKEEKDIFHMIDLIEGDFSRRDYPEVYEALLAILDGQNLSLSQQGNIPIYDVDILDISFYKGGSSVLADAYLIKGELSDQEAKMAYGYGVILQLADDLQDLEEDLKHKHNTVLNLESRLNKLDNFYSKYINFIESYFEVDFEARSERQKALKELMQISIRLLVFGGVTLNLKKFTKLKRKEIETQSYFSYETYLKTQKKVMKAYNKHMKRIEINPVKINEIKEAALNS